jgi:outer membrane protein assembly factor BamB
VNVGNQAGRAASLEADTGHLAWTELLRSPVFSISGGASSNGTFFVVDLSGGLFAFDQASGTKKWDFQFNPSRRTQFGYEDFLGPPVVAGTFVVVGLADGRLAAVDSSTGHLAWSSETGDGALQAIALAPGALVVTKSGLKGGVLAFHEGSGALTDIASPTKIQLGTVLVNYALAFLILAVLGLAGGALLRKRQASKAVRDKAARAGDGDNLVVIEDAADLNDDFNDADSDDDVAGPDDENEDE